VARAAGSLTQDLARVESTLARALDGITGDIRQDTARVANLAQDIANVTLGIKHASRKLAEFQRSTLAYKLKKVLKSWTMQ
jgi:hypothetical protein